MDYLKRKISLIDGTVNKCILMGLSYCPIWLWGTIKELLRGGGGACGSSTEEDWEKKDSLFS